LISKFNCIREREREREREKEKERQIKVLKICLSPTAGVTKLLPHISFILRPLYKREEKERDLKICLSPTEGPTKHFTPHFVLLTPAVV
jgi:hypothetical protein